MFNDEANDGAGSSSSPGLARCEQVNVALEVGLRGLYEMLGDGIYAIASMSGSTGVSRPGQE